MLKPDEAAAFMAQSGPRFCLMESEVADKEFPAIPPDWRRIEAAAEGYYSGRQRQKILVTVLIKP